MSYRWLTPHDWLIWKLEMVQPTGADFLRLYAKLMACALDSDTVQDLFQEEMDADGYFGPLDKTLRE